MINLKKLRLERNLSQQKLAENFGITQQAIFNYENGISEPDIYMLKQFADFFHTSVDYLIGYTDTPMPHSNAFSSLDSPNSAKEIHHLALYQGLAPHIQNYIDGILEELTIQKTTEKESIVP